ncbi:hypothetical protein [Roseomonas chloroacetimidivorans]|uniref:hypothetical protein n=1 Tax=Roseomonas chloroacetimidivorans TaxID=1766656 RepID=UPI003C70F41E
MTWGSKPGKGEASAQDGKFTTDYKPPCTYNPLPLEAVEEHVRANAGVIKPDALPVPGASDQLTPEQPQQPVEEQPAAEPDQPSLPGVPEPEQPETEQPGSGETEQPADAAALLDRAEQALVALRPLLTPAAPEQSQPPAGDGDDLLALFDAATAVAERKPDSKNGNKKEVLSYLKRGREQAVKMLDGGG